MAEFDVDEWWAGLTDQERELAQRHRDDDPLHPEVVRQLHADGVTVQTSQWWHWTPEVRDYLAGGCE
ncbi:hypothetical protein [Phytohabitans houttuyneae]|uniref:Uncharacterized protein n=1 Tax=Phytohabitans houttuyneae TaxID=1076126 RepID=A0A6V8KFA0_9ACTN|nr:hypothetical protein [Phytohabitans houttuyneae]GFJ79415.1 hypothetical protein Phou_035950 [Phytohabitans houttuyneae]